LLRREYENKYCNVGQQATFDLIAGAVLLLSPVKSIAATLPQHIGHARIIDGDGLKE
jgi:hypothetical protein